MEACVTLIIDVHCHTGSPSESVTGGHGLDPHLLVEWTASDSRQAADAAQLVAQHRRFPLALKANLDVL